MRLLGMLALTTFVVASAQRATARGDWSGRYHSGEAGGALELQVDSGTRGWSVRARATSEYVAAPQFQVAENVRVWSDSIAFTLNWGSAVQLRGRLVADSLAGVVSTDHWSGTWAVHRANRVDGSR